MSSSSVPVAGAARPITSPHEKALGGRYILGGEPSSTIQATGSPSRVWSVTSGIAPALSRGVAARLAARETSSRVTRAQLAVGFLERLDADLDHLRISLVNSSRNSSDDAGEGARHHLKQLQATWLQRHRATQGSLDERLSWSPSTEARRVFRIRGVTLETMEARSATDREFLSFSIIGNDRLHGSLMIEPGRSTAESMHRLAAALAPLGIRIDRLEPDGIVFSTEESRWTMLCERFVVRGGGNRFAAGQYSRPQLESLPAALAPQSWMLEDVQARRKTMYATQSAREQVTVARTRVSQFLVDSGRALQRNGHTSAERVAAFASSFATSAESANFAWLSKVLPAVKGITRERVTNLLSPRM